jgi:hypothetical protein
MPRLYYYSLGRSLEEGGNPRDERCMYVYPFSMSSPGFGEFGNLDHARIFYVSVFNLIFSGGQFGFLYRLFSIQSTF